MCTTKESSAKIVGLWVNEKKCKKFCLPEFIEECRKLNMEVVMFDLSRPLSKQGPVDVIIHKMTAVYAQALDGSLMARNFAENFESFIENNSSIPVVDPIAGVHTLLHRPATYALLDTLSQTDDQIMNPSYVELPDSDLHDKQKRLIAANLTFPIVCKPVFGCGGTEAHELAVVLSINRLAEWKGPCVAQSFIPHSAVLYKLYVLGDSWHLVVRPSLKNFRAVDAPTVHFNSANVSKAGSCSPLTQLDQRDMKGPLPTPDHTVFNRIVRMIRSSLKMDLLGIDVVIDSVSGQYAVIDVNPFPSYDSVANFMPELAKILYDKIEESRLHKEIFYSSSIGDLLLPLDKNGEGELVSRRTRVSTHLNIPILLKSRGHISTKECQALIQEENLNSTNGRADTIIYNGVCNGFGRLNVNGSNTETNGSLNGINGSEELQVTKR